MKKILFTLFSIHIIGVSLAQTINVYPLDENNTSALVNDGGIFFNHPSNGAAYEVPKGSGLNAVFAMSFMYGGVDINGQLKYSGQMYDPLSDQFRGPLTTDGSATADQSGVWDLSSLFPATKQEIDNHILNYATVGYVLPSNLANWPAHGDVSLGFDFYLAPFVDVNQNGIYDPMSGDYPCIRGDEAVYVIMNDNASAHASGGQPLGIEMHYMFYQFNTSNHLDNTTFVHGKVFNRGTQLLNDYKMSIFLDVDLGNSSDDYFGSDSSRNLMYFYNDQFDESNGQSAGYQDSPPAFGVISLSSDFEYAGSITEPASTPADFWNLMNGNMLNGTSWEDPINGVETNFMYGGHPLIPVAYTEIGVGNQPGERRGIATINGGSIGFGDVREFDLAFIYAKSELGHLHSASLLRDLADSVQYNFNAFNFDNCFTQVSGIIEPGFENLEIYPNPSSGEFTISLGTDFSDAHIEIYDVSGRNVFEDTELESNHATIGLNEPSGIYIIHLTVDGRKKIQRIVLD